MTDIIRARLREERRRVEPRQNIFAEKLGIKQSTLSEWETKAVSMKFEHLARLAEEGVDIQYVLTGRRGGGLLHRTESVLLDSFRCMADDTQAAFLVIGAQLGSTGASPAGDGNKETLHDRKAKFGAQTGE